MYGTEYVCNKLFNIPDTCMHEIDDKKNKEKEKKRKEKKIPFFSLKNLIFEIGFLYNYFSQLVS